MKKANHISRIRIRSLFLAFLFIAVFFPTAGKCENYQQTLTDLDTLLANGKYDSASTLSKQSISRLLSERGHDSTLANLMVKFSTSHTRLGHYQTAIAILDTVIAIRTSLFGSESFEVAKAQSSQGFAYYRNSEYETSEQFLLNAIRVLKKASGKDEIDYANALNNLGLLSWETGHLERAEQNLQKALTLREKHFGNRSKYYSWTLNNLGLVAMSRGDYVSGEKYFREILSIYEHIGITSAGDVWASNNLGWALVELGRPQEAIPYYVEARELFGYFLGRKHNFIALVMTNLGEAYTYLGLYTLAEAYLDSGLTIYHNLGSQRFHLAGIASLIQLYMNTNRNDAAQQIIKDSATQNILANNSGTFGFIWYYTNAAKSSLLSNDYSRCLVFLDSARTYSSASEAHSPSVEAYDLVTIRAEALWRLGKTDSARLVYETALQTNDTSSLNKTAFAAELIESNSTFKRFIGQSKSALRLAQQAFAIRLENFHEAIGSLSDRDVLNNSIFLRNSANKQLSILFDDTSLLDDYTEDAIDVILASKGRASEASFSRHKELNLLDNLGATADSLRRAKTRVAKLYANDDESSQKQVSKGLQEIISAKKRFEKTLREGNSEYREYQKALNLGYSDLKRSFRSRFDKSCLLEYMKYDYLTVHPDSAIPHYLVYAICSDGKPKVIDLGKADPIDSLVSELRRHMDQIADAGHYPTATDNKTYKAIASALFEKILKPVETVLDNQDLIYISPDAALNLVPFGSLIKSNGSYLIETAPVHYLSTGRDLLGMKSSPVSTSGLLAIGAPDFDATALARSSAIPIDTSRSSQTETTRFSRRSITSDCLTLSELIVSPLPGTGREIEFITSLWKEEHDEAPVFYLGAQASENRFKTEAPGKSVIHIATHGYFLQAQCQPQISNQSVGSNFGYAGENPLLLSGLLLAGANLHGKDTAALEDGIVTAEEVTALNLDGTDLVVLSACETAVGEVMNGEGVYGLRRAFQMAGAATVISALWSVTDNETSELMSELYQKNNEMIPSKLRRVQLAQIQKLRKAGLADHPFTWGAWIATGDWR